MKFSENWLRTFVDPPCSSDELAHLLTMAGLEVESVEPVAVIFDNVVVAEVLSVTKHPVADRLDICEVNVGLAADNQLLQIVCGAPNVRVGMKVPCALIGAKFPSFVIKQVSLRGEVSCGMLCSAKELGLNDTTPGLLLLPDDAPLGADFRDYYALEDNTFTLKLTPNRADCFGLAGIAREVSAITSVELNSPEIRAVDSVIGDVLSVDVIAPKACPLYCGRIIRNINANTPTPLWMARCLERSGVRAINVIVDITNYVMLETGQPMHAFDLAKIDGRIQVRYSRSGEQLELLNGHKLQLKSDMLLVADENNPLALAGIMGGRDSGVVVATTDIFLESAFFIPSIVAGKSFQLGFGSDSSHRFERGVDFALTAAILERTTDLIVSVCAGQPGPVTEVKFELPQRLPVKVRVNRVKRVLGVNIDNDLITKIFKRLRFDFSVDKNIFHVTPPSYRFDLLIEEDFIEELARIYGYDRIVAQSPNAALTMLPAPEVKSASQLKRIMAACDYQEVINYAFVDAVWEADFTTNKFPVGLKNPISSQMSVMRSSLIGGLIANLQFNLNRKQERVRLFEVGRCFLKHKKGYVENERLSGICYGGALLEQWDATARDIDFFDVKADIETLCWPSVVRCNAIIHPALHPGKSAEVLLDNKVAGWIGELHPRWQKKYSLLKPTVLFELDLAMLATCALPVANEITKYPPIRRDIAVIVANNVSVQELLDCMLAVKVAIISAVDLFDIYHGEGMREDEKSLAFRVLLQDTKKTLIDKEVDTAVSRLVAALECRFGAKLRN